MIKKIMPQRSQISKQSISDEEFNSEQACNKESLVLVEEKILEDLAQATSISGALAVFQSSFKILVELLRHLSVHINAQNQEQPSSQNTLTPDGLWKDELGQILHRLLNQLFVLKIEALTTSQEVEDRKLILENFSDVFCKDMLEELAVCMKKVVEKATIDTVFSKLRNTVAHLVDKLSQNPGTLNKWKQTKSEKIEKGIGTEDGLMNIEAKPASLQKGVQADISYKNSGQQVEDVITEKKIELLMNANKKLKTECDAYVQEKSKQIQTLILGKQELETEVIRLNGKFSESQNICEELNKRMESKLKEFQKMKDLVLEIEAEKEGLKRKVELTMKELVQSVNNEQEYKDQLTSLSNDMKSFREKNLKLLELEKENEIVRENNRNVYDEVERMKTNYKQIHEKLKEVIVETSGKIQALEEALQAKVKELNEEKENRSKSEYRARELENIINSRNQTSHQETNLDKRTEQENLNLRGELELKMNAIKIMEAELKSKQDELQAMESSWKGKLEVEIRSVQKEAMDKISQLKHNFEGQVTLQNSKHNAKIEELKNHYHAEIEKMSAAIQSSEHTHERLLNEISERDSLVKDLKNANNLSLDRCLQAENKLELLSHKMENKSRELDSVEEWKGRFEAEIKLLKEKLNEGSYRQRDLEKEVNSARDGKKLIAARNEQLEREREGLEERIKVLTQEVGSLEGDKIKLQGLVQTVNSDHSAFIDQQSTDLMLTRKELSEKQGEVQELQNKLKEAEEAHKSAIESYEERISGLKESMVNDTDLKKKMDDLQKINMDKQTQLVQQKVNIEELFNVNSRLESELNASKVKIQGFSEELKRIKGENSNLFESLKNSEELSMRREVELKKLQHDVEDLKKAQDEVSRKGMLVSEYQSNMRSLSDELNETQNKLKEVLERNNEKEQQLSTLQSKIHDHAMTIKRGNEEYKNLEKEVFELRELKPLKKEIINSSIQQNILREDITAKEKRILVLNGELEGVRDSLMKKCKEMEELSINFKKVIEDVKEKKSEDLKKTNVNLRRG
jgi:chromosome segregation ATPase